MINSVLLFFIFVFFFISISVLGFLLLKNILPDLWENHLTHESVGISGSILDVLAIFVSIPLSFILIFLWNEYNKKLNAIHHLAHELTNVYQQLILLHLNTSTFKKYLNTHKREYFEQFKQELYTFVPAINQKHVMKQLLTTVNHIVIDDHPTQVSQEIWYVIVIGVIAVILGTWFAKSPFWLHIYLIVSVATILATLVFLIYFYDLLLTNCSKDLKIKLFDKID